MVPVTGKLALILVVFGVALCLCPVARGAPKYKVLHNFTGSDGNGPYSGVIIDQKGNLYGTTVGGGSGGCCGTVFELTRNLDGKWTESLLHTFENNGRDGAAPYGGLIFDAAGNLYGTAYGGGAHNGGNAFELTPGQVEWTETILYSFGTHSHDAYAPSAGLVMDSVGNLYGTGHAVFELKPTSGGWNEKVLHRFCSWTNCRDGDGPFAGLILDASGNLYGTTEAGGGICGSCGVVFELTPTSGGRWKELVLHRFDNNGKDGYTPGGGALMMDGSGNLYGTTETGGCCGGTAFKLTPGSGGHWKETILYNFKPGAGGWFPTAGVVMDKAGNLYGTTVDGGNASCSCGVVYKLAPGAKGKWTYTVLHRFSGTDGAIPAGNLILDDQGNFYGGTVLGGPANDGVVFELTP
jgi:uncharacterized repeat protein (TIGR03803 family)